MRTLIDNFLTVLCRHTQHQCVSDDISPSSVQQQRNLPPTWPFLVEIIMTTTADEISNQMKAMQDDLTSALEAERVARVALEEVGC